MCKMPTPSMQGLIGLKPKHANECKRNKNDKEIPK